MFRIEDSTLKLAQDNIVTVEISADLLLLLYNALICAQKDKSVG